MRNIGRINNNLFLTTTFRTYSFFSYDKQCSYGIEAMFLGDRSYVLMGSKLCSYGVEVRFLML